MSKETPEAILAKIRKLLSLAEGAKKIGSLAEAESAALKAQELMAQYNLEIHDIDMNPDDKKFQVKEEILNGDDLNVKNEGSWMFDLYKVIARYNFCMIIFTSRQMNKGIYNQKPNQEDFEDHYKYNKAYKAWYKKAFPPGHTLMVLGEPHNVEMTQYIVDQLASKVRPLCKAAWRKYDSDWMPQDWVWADSDYGRTEKVAIDENGNEKEKKNAFVRGYLLGFVQGVSAKLYEQKQKMEKKQPQLVTMALTLTNKVEKWQKENIPTKPMGTGNMGRSKSETGRDEGYKAGKNATINKGVGKSTFNQNLLK